jgi:hypothetical protein
MEKNPTQKSFKIKKKCLPEAAHMTKKVCFWGITVQPKIGIL